MLNKIVTNALKRSAEAAAYAAGLLAIYLVAGMAMEQVTGSFNFPTSAQELFDIWFILWMVVLIVLRRR